MAQLEIPVEQITRVKAAGTWYVISSLVIREVWVARHNLGEWVNITTTENEEVYFPVTALEIVEA